MIADGWPIHHVKNIRAWLWFAACLSTLALAVLLGSQGRLVNNLPLRDPATQRVTAREILRNLGYRETPADDLSVFWGFRNVLGRQSAFPEATLDG